MRLTKLLKDWSWKLYLLRPLLPHLNAAAGDEATGLPLASGSGLGGGGGQSSSQISSSQSIVFGRLGELLS